MKHKVEFIGGPIDGTKEEVSDSIDTIRVPEGKMTGWYEGPISEHVYERGNVFELNKFYYKSHDDPETTKKKIIEGMG